MTRTGLCEISSPSSRFFSTCNKFPGVPLVRPNSFIEVEGERKGANLLETGDLAGLQGGGIQHQHRTQAEDVPEQLVVLGAEKAVSSGPRGTTPRVPPPRLPAHLKVVVHPRTQRILEGGVDPAPSPAVHIEHLEAEADGLLLTLAALQVRGARTGLGGCARGSGGLHPRGAAPFCARTSTKCSTARKVERWRRRSALARYLLLSVARVRSSPQRASVSS